MYKSDWRPVEQIKKILKEAVQEYLITEECKKEGLDISHIKEEIQNVRVEMKWKKQNEL